MPYTDEGYTKSTETQIIRAKEVQFSNLFGVYNNSVSDVLWQYIKNSVYERQEIETLNEIAAEQMSISEASGIFLDKHGIECGITRKGATKAQGYVEVSRTINKAPFTIPAGTQFTSATQTYSADEDSTIPYIIEMTKTKTGESDDFFSSDIPYVESIEKILDENNNVIDTSYYTLDSTYNNNIQWVSGSSAILVANESYFVYISGTVTRRVEVSSVNTGPNANASITTVTTCVQYPTLTVTNEEEIDGGAIRETDSAYRTRLLNARRRTFTLANIKSIIDSLEGVRACKVYQDTGIDQHSVLDWDNPDIIGWATITGTTPFYSQSFVPGDQIATLGKITLYGEPINDPPAIILGIKRDISAYGTGAGVYFDYDVVEEYEIDQSVTGTRDIEFIVSYNGLDKTKTYRFDIMCDNPQSPTFDWEQNYWRIAMTDEGYGTGLRKALYELSGETWRANDEGYDFMFKTHFNGAGYSAIVAPADGYGFENLKTTITGMLDYVGAATNPGYSPICIQSTILEADEILIDVKGTIYITALADFQNVRREVNDSIEEYLESLNVGDNVVYSRIYQIIMDHPQVNKLENLQIKREDQVEYVTHDLGITDIEIPDLGSRSFQSG